MKKFFMTMLLAFAVAGTAKADVTARDFANTKWLGRTGHYIVDFKVALNLAWTGHSVDGSNKVDRAGNIDITYNFPQYDGVPVLMLLDYDGNAFIDFVVQENGEGQLPTLEAIEVPGLVLSGKIIR